MPKEAEARLAALENAVRELQEKIRKGERTVLYLLTLLLSAARELGLEKEVLSRLMKDSVGDLDKILGHQEFRKIMKNVQGGPA
jgi:hypothetical protein